MRPESGNSALETPSVEKTASLLRIVRIVVSMLFMVGRNRDYAADAPAIGPTRLIMVAIVAAALLIAALVMLATFIAR